ncbi:MULTISPECIES: malto-oligosyltrehalose synthase [unclassified Chelatococcus]|uniref:malto-oligosyltrehalose synthase n=1 Tax=unclassified Chelatococcus TaxID=2638111 RepID=UPI001BCCF824|nr:MULTISPECIES: malto-oligosyltrehalose synthase [unclassified Chelatococcus]CAH1654001.1 Malto-oligosyltrehalose synthase [Hyphomicrobiales bacterium]MBS7742839.1 malto-oligosyltrehalose synthase [Chelatococcus sp. HY11]MBX3542043.1 malto-oligosyltrehalose synthase [Chelatococcus sp.]MCO5074065.1 malto-oligosyltrehalose synthase [Chelatococcus sp.]CAH1694724.1 Malto-oligosyltrehalose synthase [Hyphomicrobiales bacterium]
MRESGRTYPRATMRLQLHGGFTFDDAAGVVPYMADLGISHLYTSPILTARPGSTHGYDVVDPMTVNVELGGEPGLLRLVERLRSHDMGLIVDSVPNHMGVGRDNIWWMDVLASGRHSEFARFFDIDWDAYPRVILPVLGDTLDNCIDRGEINVVLDADSNALAIAYGEHHFPLSSNSTPGRPTSTDPHEPKTPTASGLRALLARQHYELVFWREAAKRLNWRRFFDINELVAVRVEDPVVFEATHAALFRLYAEGVIDGLRIDHIDGLTDPYGYCRALRQRLADLEARRPPGAPRGPYVIVEKILAEREDLPQNWGIDGSTGYDFMDEVGSFLHDAEGELPLTRLWQEGSGRAADFHAEERQARTELLEGSLRPEFERAAAALTDVARGRGPVLEKEAIGKEAITSALRALVINFPVYRTYAGAAGRPKQDAWAMEEALAAARSSCPEDDVAVLAEIDRWLGGEAPDSLASGEERDKRVKAIQRFQQLTAPLAAKSVEDTAFYRYGRLLSRNEVGSNPGLFARDADAFLARSLSRGRDYPGAMLATATHDHKRGEDVRARLAVLSECAEEWMTQVRAWRHDHGSLLAQVGATGEAGEDLMLYQMIVGAWPYTLRADDSDGLKLFAERLAGWQEKALREAKLRTSWTAPDDAYEAAQRQFLFMLLDPTRCAFAGEAGAFVGRIAPAGALNGLAQTLLRLTLPGVPDTYQGTEFWDFSLVDPDNRRPVDFAARQAALATLTTASDRAASWQDGRVKQAVAAHALRARKAHPGLFADGIFEPLTATGTRSDNIFAFGRQAGNRSAITIVSRIAFRLLGNSPHIPVEALAQTRVCIPPQLKGRYHDVMSGRTVKITSDLRLADVLLDLPVALLIRDEAEPTIT